MSYWSDYKAGCISESEYTRYCNREALEEQAREKAEWEAYLRGEYDEDHEEDPDEIDEW